MKTKLYLSGKTSSLLSKGTKMYGISRTDFIKKTIKIFEVDHDGNFPAGQTVKYQKSDKSRNWTMFHLRLSESEYEHFTDLRNFCKMSLSLIVALSVKIYFRKISSGQICKKLLNYMDNYPHSLFPVHIVTVTTHNNGFEITTHHRVPT